MRFVADVTAHLRDVTAQHVFVDRVPGRNDAPYTPAQHRAKLDELSVDVIGAKWSARLFAMVDELDPGTSVTALTSLPRPQ